MNFLKLNVFNNTLSCDITQSAVGDGEGGGGTYMTREYLVKLNFFLSFFLSSFLPSFIPSFLPSFLSFFLSFFLILFAAKYNLQNVKEIKENGEEAQRIHKSYASWAISLQL